MLQRLLDARDKARAEAQSTGGFTLIELLIVIVILGVLAGVVVFAVGAFSGRGERAACQADFKAVEVAVEAYRANNGTYPASVDALVPGYLREAPSSPECEIELADDGTLTVTGAYEATSNGGGGGGGEEEPEAPGAVSGLASGSVTTNSASITWSEPTTGGAPASYTVEWGTAADFSGAQLDTNATSPFALTGLTASTTYHVRVQAVNDAGPGDWSTASFTTNSPPPAAPNAPTGVNVSCTGSGFTRSCSVNFTASTTGTPIPAYQWEVDFNSGGGGCGAGDFGWVLVASGSATASPHSIGNLWNNVDYCLRIRATNSAGQSGWAYHSFEP